MEEKNTTKTVKKESVDAQTAESVSTVKNSAPIHSTVVAVIVVALVAAAGAYYFMSKAPDGADEMTESVARTEYPDAVAKVNGEELSREDFLLSISQAEQAAQQQGADLNDPAVKAEIESQAMVVLINSTLLAQAATESGVTVSEADIEARISELEVQYGGAEAFSTALESASLTRDELRENVTEQLLIDAYLESDVTFSGIIVTDTEVQEAYDGLATQGPGLPPLEEISEPLRQQLLAQKQQEAIGVLIDGLRVNADIETLI